MSNGRLWIVAVNADDSATVLFPNEVMPDNRISAGTALGNGADALDKVFVFVGGVELDDVGEPVRFIQGE